MSREWKVLCALFVVTALTRLPFADPYLYHLDSGNFALALYRFDVSVHQPHPPGYFLYVMLGRLVMLITGDANTALVAVSIFFSALAVGTVYLMGKSVYGHREGISAAVIALTSPLLWLHGIVSLSYASEAFFSVLIAYLCYRIYRGEGRLLWISAVVLGVAGGFRQSTLVFLLPLWAYSVRRQGIRRVLLSSLVVVLVSLCWFLPMAYMSGGPGSYMAALHSHESRTVMVWASLASVPQNLRFQLAFLAWGLLAALVPLTRYAVSRARARGTSPGDGLAAFFLFWLMPSVLFYVLIFSTGLTPGYSLTYMVGLYILAGKAVVAEAENLAGAAGRLQPRRLLPLFVAMIAIINTIAFFWLDFRYSYRGLVKNNQRLETYLEALSRFPPGKTVVLASQNVFVSNRHAAYYLPEYDVYSVSDSLAGGCCFKMKGRDTAVSRGIIVPPEAEYIVFFEPYKKPLPETPLKLGARFMQLKDGYYMLYYARGRGPGQWPPMKDILSSCKEQDQ